MNGKHAICKSSKSEKISQSLAEELLSGVYGKSGDHFISVRELAKIKNISLVTAQRTVDKLRQKRLLYLYNLSNYITTGRISEESPLFKAINRGAKNSRDLPIIGVHFPRINNEFFATLLKEVVSVINRSGYMAMVMLSDGNAEMEKEILGRFISLGVSGVITCPNDDVLLKDIYSLYPLPVVYLAKRSSFYDSDYVAVDEINSAGYVAKHFIEMGYENFMYVGFEKNADKDYRLNSFRRELEKLGKAIPQENIILLKETDKFTIPGNAARAIANAKKPMGIFCFHDLVAIELLITAKKRNLRVPEDVGIVGFDNLDIAAKHSPTLSTVGYRFDTMANSAVKMLLDMIAQNEFEPSPPVLVRYALHIRESSRRKV